MDETTLSLDPVLRACWMKMGVQKRILLPAHCTELNPIERFWRYLKDLTCANQLWSSLKEVTKKVEQVLHQQNAHACEYRSELSKNL